MSEFLSALHQYGFLQNALLAGLLASVACGVVGSYVVVRRISYIAGGIAHCVLGGMGFARYCQVVYHWDFFKPLYGAVAAALLSAIIIGLISLRARQREDTAIGALWAIGMATGILFISKTPGYSQDLMSYLFGNILMVTKADLWLIGGLDVAVVGVGVLFYNKLLAICFDEEYARLRGLHVEAYFLLLLCLTALTVVLLLSVVGIVMVIALLTLPAAVAGKFTHTLRGMMLLSILFCAFFTTGGLALSYGPNLPAGATIVVLAGIAFLAVSIGGKFLKKRAPLKRAAPDQA